MNKPATSAPELKLETVSGDQWTLSEQQPAAFTMIVFYRGLHCPICKQYLKELTAKLDDFSQRGVEILAASMDDDQRAARTVKEWDIEGLPLGYGLSEASARGWGLFISEHISDKEPERFSEPGLFLVKPDGSLYASSIQTMPFARPPLEDIISAIDFIASKNYPPRGSA